MPATEPSLTQGDETARIVAAVSGLEQVLVGIAGILEQHGAMLARLLDAAEAPAPEESRMERLLEALIGRLDRQQQTLNRIEAGITTFTDALAKTTG